VLTAAKRKMLKLIAGIATQRRKGIRLSMRHPGLLAASLLLASALAEAQSPPSFTSTPGATVTADAAYLYQVRATDPDPDDTLTLSAPVVPGWLSLTDHGDGTASLAGHPTNPDTGVHLVTLAVTDSTMLTALQTFAITVTAAGEEPFFRSAPVTRVDEGTVYAYRVEADPGGGGGPVTITATGLPTWLTFTPDGDRHADLAGTPGATEVGEHSVSLQATDQDGLTATQSFTITVVDTNAAPAFTSAPPTAVNEGGNYDYAITTADSNPGDTRAISGVLLPGWLTLTDNGDGTGMLAGMPGAAEIGAHDVELAVTDAGGLAATQVFTVTVASTNGAPGFTSVPVTAATAGTPYSYAVAAVDPDGDALGFSLTVAPAWLALSDNGDGTAVLAGTPAVGDAGEASVTIGVSDPEGLSATQSFAVTVTIANSAPAFVSTPVTAASEGTPYSYAVAANDADGNPLAFSAPALPGWLTLTDNGDGTAVVSGTPTEADIGANAVQLAVTDGSATTAQAFSIDVSDVNHPPTFTSAPPVVATEDTAYTALVEAVDEDGDALSFAAATLPPWLAMIDNDDGTATLTGVPDADQIGVFAVGIRVSDDEGLSADLVFDITVGAFDDLPVIEPVPAQTASENVPFSLDLSAFASDEEAGTELVYAVSGLPAGLAFDAATGLVDGIPQLGNSAGEYLVGFTVSDGVNPPVATSFMLTVLRADRLDLSLAIAVTPNPVVVNGTATWTFTVANAAPQVAAGSGVALGASFSGDGAVVYDPAPAACTLTPLGGATELACTLGPLAGGSSTTLSVSGTANRSGDVLAVGEVSVIGNTPVDERPANDSASATLSVTQEVADRPAQTITGVNATAVDTADFNGDGHLDLVVATAAGQPVRVYLNIVDPDAPGKRVFSDTPIALGPIGNHRDVVALDIDNDGDPDIVSAGAAGTANGVYMNAGNASFSTGSLGNPNRDSHAVAVGDIDGDGFADIVFANASADTLFRGSGTSAGFTGVGTIGDGNSTDVLLADVSGADGLPELVVARGDGDALIYPNNLGMLNLNAPVALSTGATTSVAARDLNGDSRLDLVFGRDASDGGNSPANLVFLNSSAAAVSFAAAPDRLGVSSTQDVLAFDPDLDGDADLVFVNRNGVHQVFTNSASSSAIFVLHPVQLTTGPAQGGVSGSLSADQRADLAIVSDDGISIFYNDGSGKLGAGDETPPVISLIGSNGVTIEVGQAYVDMGATATDETDGDVSERITTENPVDTSVVGSYTVRYEVMDLSGNAASPATRNVNVHAREAAGASGGGGGGGGAFGLLGLLGLLGTPLLVPFLRAVRANARCKGDSGAAAR
jgi:hypothetical protein